MILNTLILEALIKILGVSPDEAGLTAVALKVGVATIMMVVSFCGMLLIVFVGLKKEGDELAMSDNTYIPYQPYHHSLTVVLPAYNEEQNIAKTLSDTLSLLSRLVRDYEIIVVNDGSKDRTAEQLKYIMAMSKSVRLVNHTVNQGYGAALVSGFEAATKELTMFMDSDGQFSIISLARMLPHIDEVDAVFGYRIKRQDTWMRKLNARCWKFLVYTVFGVNLHDLDCAFKVMRTRFLHEHPLETRGAVINAELVYKFLRAGMSYQEVGVHHYSRVAGVATGAKPKVILRALRDVCICQ